jgi:general secretion pathway protein I
MRRAQGFTLLEVLIALAIVAVSAGALLGTVTSSASNVIYLKDKTLAEWVALNRLAEIRTDQQKPQTGRRMGATVMGGMRWEWQEEVTELPIDGMLRIEVRAHNTGEAVDDSKPQQTRGSSTTQPQTASPTTAATSKSDKIAWTSTAVGVVGSATDVVRTPFAVPMGGTQTNQPQPPGTTPTPPSPRGAPSS